MNKRWIKCWNKQLIASSLSALSLMGCGSDSGDGGTDTQFQWQQAVSYEVFVRSYYDANGDGIGDLKGVEQKLDYLDELGIDSLWLTPIHPSPTYHGYAVSDYMSVHPDFGDLDDMRSLLNTAHDRGMRVVMDLVVNHTSTEHAWFQGMLSNDPTYEDFYVCGDTAIDGNWGEVAPELYCYFAFGPQSGLPDLNYDNPQVREAVKEVAAFWIEMGVDGFRLDVAQDIGDGDDSYSVAWWQEFQAYAESLKEDIYIIGEVNYDSTDANTHIAPYLQGMDSAFNFPLYNEILVTSAGLTKDILATLNPARSEYALFNHDFIDASIIGNHDRSRVASELNFNEHKIRKAVTLQMTLPGLPYIYYGDEIGMRGGHDLQGDPHKREPMEWYADVSGEGMTEMLPAIYGASAKNLMANDGISVEEQSGQSDSLLAYYQTLIAIRKANPILTDGDFVRVGTPAGTYGYHVASDDADYQLMVVHNQSLTEQVMLSVTAETTELISTTPYQQGEQIIIEPFASIILRSSKETLPIKLSPIPDDQLDESPVALHITVRVPEDTPVGTMLYMPNSDDGWDPAELVVNPEVTLMQTGDFTYEIDITRNRGTRMEYKFFRGSWENSETDAQGHWTGNRVFLFVDDENNVEVNIQGWRDVDYQGD